MPLISSTCILIIFPNKQCLLSISVENKASWWHRLDSIQRENLCVSSILLSLIKWSQKQRTVKKQMSLRANWQKDFLCLSNTFVSYNQVTTVYDSFEIKYGLYLDVFSKHQKIKNNQLLFHVIWRNWILETCC